MADEKLQPTILEITDQTLALDKLSEIEKKDNKKEVALSESFYLLFKNLDHPAVITDDKNNIININTAFSTKYYLNLEQIKGKKINSLIKKNKILVNSQEHEINIDELDVGLVKIFILKSLEEKKENERLKKYKRIIESGIDDMVLIIRKNGKILDFNEAVKKNINDVDFDKNIKDIVKISKLNQKIKEAADSKTPSETAGQIISQNNISVNVKIIPLDEELFSVILKNRSEFTNLNEQIKIVKEQYEQLVNNTTDLICIIDKTGKFKFVNKQFEKQLGYKIESIPNIFQIICPEDVPNFIRSLNASENSKKGFQDQEIRIYNNKKKLLYFAISGLPLVQNGVVIEYSMTLRNITEKKKNEDETLREKEKLKEDFKRLSEVNKMKTEFVSMVSHDLKTPLTNIQGYASLLRNKILGPNTPKQQEAADIIDKESKRLARLINDLLDLSKIDSGAIKLQMRPFNIKYLEERCALRNMAERKGLVFIWNAPENLSEMYGDPERIAQVLTNLVNNAIKFTDKGSVTVNIFEKDKNYIQIDVIDTGPGIPKKEQELIFERFQRSSISKLNKKEGSGLGLAIAKEIMKLHGSDITVKSEVGKGSIFSIVLRKAPKSNGVSNLDQYIENIGVGSNKNINNISNDKINNASKDSDGKNEKMDMIENKEVKNKNEIVDINEETKNKS